MPYLAVGTPFYTSLAQMIADPTNPPAAPHIDLVADLSDSDTLGALKAGYVYFLVDAANLSWGDPSGWAIEGLDYLTIRLLEEDVKFISAQGTAVAYASKPNCQEGAYSVSNAVLDSDKSTLTVAEVLAKNYYDYLIGVNIALSGTGKLAPVNGLTRCYVKLTAQTTPAENGIYTYIYNTEDDKYTLTAVTQNEVAVMVTGVPITQSLKVNGMLYETAKSLVLYLRTLLK